jgi:putative CRISPR-associated protein (TIGR02619 family)
MTYLLAAAGLSILRALGIARGEIPAIARLDKFRGRCPDPRKVGELNTAVVLSRAVGGPVELDLVATDAPESLLAARLLVMCAEETKAARPRGYVAVKRFTPGSYEGAAELIEAAVARLASAEGDKSVSVTTGFNLEAVYLALAGWIAGAQVIYVDEEGNLHRVPQISVGIDDLPPELRRGRLAAGRRGSFK